MPRDATITRTRRLREATRVFAEQGAYRATLRDITQVAGQRNASALTNHFRSREGVLWAILDTHNGPVDALRAARLTDPVEAMDPRDLLGALLVPYATKLATPDERNYLRVVAQLTALFPSWRDGPLSPPALRKIFDASNAEREATRRRAGSASSTPRFCSPRRWPSGRGPATLHAPPSPVLDRFDVRMAG